MFSCLYIPSATLYKHTSITGIINAYFAMSSLKDKVDNIIMYVNNSFNDPFNLYCSNKTKQSKISMYAPM
ncbi:hypothetical protein TUM16657_06360 [Enterobacter cloacae]|nr:hypothetical protein EBZU44_00260 [Enterobacter cloacae]GJJ94563.1 hypothetical protein TUM16654_28430 [Enterobacter cloacae]GJK08045.1 hypothetical protein TUM16657_06360 [Enterobacter cloacae]